MLCGGGIDPLRGCLRRNGEEIYLRPKTLQVLIYLIEQRGRLVTKEELMESIWKDTAVTDDALVQQLPCVECFEMGIQRVERLRKNVRS